ncbi:hypothetical protein DUNSADRAFT_6308, partial [Dunaliella salina]
MAHGNRVTARTLAVFPTSLLVHGIYVCLQVVLFMKGNKQFPQCGFSNTVVQILNAMDAPFEHVDILANDSLRVGMKEYSQWPTFPQV